MKKILSLFIICIFTISMFGGCSITEDDDNVVNISILNSKPEIEDALRNVINEFTKENSDINVKLVKYNQGITYLDKLRSMEERNSAPTISIVDAAHISQFRDSLINLSSEEWVKDISGEVTEIAKDKDGNIIAFPFALEGAGFIYNKKVVEEAGVDVSKIKTIESLEDAFKRIESIGKKAIVITNEEWSLGDHFLATFYAADMEGSSFKGEEYFKNLKNSDLKNNKVLNGLIDTFDIMKNYNIYATNPLAPSYSKCSEVLGKGEVAFWYMGNWASQSILANNLDNSEFGFISVPISNNSEDYGNNEIALGVTKYIVINDKNSSKDQQEAAKRFLNYLVYNEKGNKFMVEDAGIIPYFKNINIDSEDPLTNEIIKYRDNGNSMELSNSYFPDNNSKILGNELKKYLNNEISRENLIDTIIEFWSNY